MYVIPQGHTNMKSLHSVEIPNAYVNVSRVRTPKHLTMTMHVCISHINHLTEGSLAHDSVVYACVRVCVSVDTDLVCE